MMKLVNDLNLNKILRKSYHTFLIKEGITWQSFLQELRNISPLAISYYLMNEKIDILKNFWLESQII